MSSYTFTETFTRTHARHLAGRVTSDLRQSYLLYGSPPEARLGQYMDELEELLAGGYVKEYQFGFERNGQSVWSLRYKVGPDGMLNTSGAAGGVPARINILGADFFNFLTFSTAWFALSTSAKGAVEAKLPFSRTTGGLPGTANGSWVTDRTFAAGGVALERSTFRAAS
jgi:hypothetical protein